MIPADEFVVESNVACVTNGLIKQYHSEEEVFSFEKWFVGQTGMILKDGSLGIYAWDYERWLEQGKETAQRATDWD